MKNEERDPADHAAPELSARRMRTRKARFAEIREAAMDLVNREGLEGLTMNMVAKQLDCVAGTLYRYFPSKEKLVVDLQMTVIAEITAWLSAGLDRRRQAWVDADPKSRSLALILEAPQLYLGYAQEHPAHFKLLSQSIADPDPVVSDHGNAARSVGALLGTLVQMAKVFADAEAVGTLEPGEHLQRAVVLWLSSHAITATRKMARVTPAFEARLMLDYSSHALLRGWGADPHVLAAANQLRASGAG